MRILDRSAEIETRYGGGFVQSIDGLAGGSEGGRRSDWFFFVNGIESPIGAADFDLSDGDRVWWDHRDWTSAMRVPAVVGSWPEPFVHGFRGERWRTGVECRTDSEEVCERVEETLTGAGAEMSETPSENEGSTITVAVGPWPRLRQLPELHDLEEGPAESGVFASFTPPGPVLLNLLNERGEVAGSLGQGAGLVAAVRSSEHEDAPPVWVVSGTDRGGVEAAAGTLGEALANHYAVAVDAAGPVGVPVP
jgi:Domain of unknown function (DUF4430)